MTVEAAEDIGFWVERANRTEAHGVIDLPFGRDDLAHYFAASGARNGVEIGVEQGLYSEVLCKANPQLRLLCVDAWQAYPDYREHVSQSKIDGFFASAQQRLAPYRAILEKGFSVDVARTIADGCLDFVFIDGNHTLPQVIADIAAWEPKVRPGGIVAGHDYRTSKGKAGAVFHVPYAVQAWTKAYGIDPLFVLRGDKSPSWFWIKSHA